MKVPSQYDTTIEVAEFLKRYVEDYLLGDLAAMAPIRPPGKGKIGGGVAYPMVSTALAGIELLGGLVAEQHCENERAFSQGWCYVYPSLGNLATVVYQLVRHGLAHQFLPKPGIRVCKGIERVGHLQMNDTQELVIDALLLAEDLEAAYQTVIRPLALGPRLVTAQRNLDRMITNASHQAGRQQHVATLAGLQVGTFADRVPGSLEGATGTAFAVNSPTIPRKP